LFLFARIRSPALVDPLVDGGQDSSILKRPFSLWQLMLQPMVDTLLGDDLCTLLAPPTAHSVVPRRRDAGATSFVEMVSDWLGAVARWRRINRPCPSMGWTSKGPHIQFKFSTMAARATWKGFLKISLVNIPIKVFPATESSGRSP
jgi:hypothetical protein